MRTCVVTVVYRLDAEGRESMGLLCSNALECSAINAGCCTTAPPAQECRFCDFPKVSPTGTHCVCMSGYFKEARTTIAAVNDHTRCSPCVPGMDCSLINTSIETVALLPNFWVRGYPCVTLKRRGVVADYLALEGIGTLQVPRTLVTSVVSSFPLCCGQRSSNVTSTDVRQCPTPGACKWSSAGPCDANRHGPLCDLCNPGTSSIGSSDGSCTPCVKGALFSLTVAGIVVVTLGCVGAFLSLVLVVLMWRSHKKEVAARRAARERAQNSADTDVQLPVQEAADEAEDFSVKVQVSVALYQSEGLSERVDRMVDPYTDTALNQVFSQFRTPCVGDVWSPLRCESGWRRPRSRAPAGAAGAG
jgi:hypothetical protein